jgi:NAD(P)H-nitrite reductase large subunit
MSLQRKGIGPLEPMPDDAMIICRCEEVTKGEIRAAVHSGMFNLREVRRLLRCGMGLCQGQTCSRLVRQIIAQELSVPAGDVEEATARLPVRPTELAVFANERNGEGK